MATGKSDQPADRDDNCPSSAFGCAVMATGSIVVAVSGPSNTYLLTSEDEWFRLNEKSLSLKELPPLDGKSSAAVAHAEHLFVGLYDSRVARFSNGAWSYFDVAETVVALLATEDSVLCGDLQGNLTQFDSLTESVASVYSPITALQLFGDDTLVLSRDGTVYRTNKGGVTKVSAVAIDADRMGSVRGLFRANETGHVGLFSSYKVALLNPSDGSLSVSQPFPNSIFDVIPVGSAGRVAVLTDVGELWLADLRDDYIRAVELPDGHHFAGMARGPNSVVTAWTTDGVVFDMDGDGDLQSTVWRSVCMALTARGRTQLMVINKSDGQLAVTRREATDVSEKSGPPS